MKTVFLSASELAKLTKDNKYEDPEKTLNGILKKNGLSDVYVPKSNVEESLSKLSPDKLKEIKKELSLPETANKKDIEDAVKQTIMKKSLKADITEDKSKKKIDKKIADKPVLAAALETGIKKDLMMRRGNVKENQNLNKTQQKENIVISSRNSQMYTKTLYVSEDAIYKIVIRGKVDGIVDDVIVETKNRTKRLFHRIPNYEKVQLEAYMFLTEMDKAIHIECYNEEQNKTDYNHDAEFWEDRVAKIIAYVEENIAPLIK
tara:strand:- start:103 stop:885 length:783 start_codon:yes stop_codon:yes gene_type:complete